MDSSAEMLAYFVRQSIDAAMVNVHTAIPGIIQSFDRTKFLCTVQPALKRSFPDGLVDPTKNTPPVIQNVPYLMPRAGGAFLRLPVLKGDSCLILFSERSLDNWLGTGGVVDPQDQRRFDFSDAMVIPGLFDFAHPPTADSGADTSIVMANGGGQMEVTTAGKFKLTGSSGDELLTQLGALCTALENAIPVCAGIEGTFLPATITAIQLVATKIAGLSG